jgi:hypothetical protein
VTEATPQRTLVNATVKRIAPVPKHKDPYANAMFRSCFSSVSSEARVSCEDRRVGAAGFSVERVPNGGLVTPSNVDYLRTKDNVLGHLGSLDPLTDPAHKAG